MEEDIITSLKSLGYLKHKSSLNKFNQFIFLCVHPLHRYSGSLSDVFQEEGNEKSLIELSKVINFLSDKLCSVCYTEERVNVISSSRDVEMLCMELSGLLRELCKQVLGFLSC